MIEVHFVEDWGFSMLRLFKFLTLMERAGFKISQRSMNPRRTCTAVQKLSMTYSIIKEKYGDDICQQLFGKIGCSWDGVGLNACWELYFIR